MCKELSTKDSPKETSIKENKVIRE
uniref:Uncharacterized protein n=1 Tax=Anguilla anguilla TaxID=7936 RepID=A0A0E9RVI8_ANGAN